MKICYYVVQEFTVEVGQIWIFTDYKNVEIEIHFGVSWKHKALHIEDWLGILIKLEHSKWMKKCRLKIQFGISERFIAGVGTDPRFNAHMEINDKDFC